MARASFQKIKLLKKNIGIVAITAYDASFARYFDELGFDIILIGDSPGEVIKGQKNTHNVSLENIYITLNLSVSCKKFIFNI